MKKILITSLLFSVLNSTVYALPGISVIDPEDVSIAAKYAKEKAKIIALEAELPDYLLPTDENGCDLNVGNVIVDENANDVPDELIIIIEGDIIQANECKTH